MQIEEKAILRNKQVIPVTDVIEWAKEFERGESRQVARDEIDGTLVSTVFLGLNHGWFDKPLWFETLVFAGPLDDEMSRYETWKEAEEGHRKMVGRVRKAQKKMTYLNGFLWGAGFMTAVVIFRVVLHVHLF